MKAPTTAQLNAARRLLAREAQEAESAEERATAARRVCETIVAHLSTLVGPSAARALFARSVKLSAPDFPCLGKVDLAVERAPNLPEQLEACLRGENPDAVTEASLALYATLLALLGTLIGERLTSEVLRDSWPVFRVSSAPKEETE